MTFDQQGALVDWTDDDGDDPAYLARWGGFKNWRTTTQDEAARRMQTAQSE